MGMPGCFGGSEVNDCSTSNIISHKRIANTKMEPVSGKDIVIIKADT